ncbi:MAG: hypothetical protein NT124_00805 [Candidatus Dependentiae bacterium]|nr:hypothetical protein [Candidatus Dependentiae bacterium]
MHIRNLDENILVVQRQYIFPEGEFNGLRRVDFEQYLELINTHKQFLPRSSMEMDVSYKQIIPYLVFTHNNRYFLMQRHAQASESRLQSKFSLGIGGHIRQKDMQNDDIYAWAKREFCEEVAYSGSLRVEPIGILNDDSNDVGKVHIGFVFLLHGDSADISVKSELASGTLVTLEECDFFKSNMESWSQMVHGYLSIN